MTLPNLDRIRNIHLIGIGGCGMSAVAKVLHEMGYKISGSDVKESANTIRLEELGVKVTHEHSASNLREADLVIYSTAISKDNPERQGAKDDGIPLFSRAEMLSWIMDQSKVSIAVSGTHGKTTTTSMLSLLFDRCGLNPTYLIGGETDVSGNARLGNGRFAIAEADESDGSFLKLNPSIAIVTNIEDDHLDYYGTEEKIMDGFIQFANKLPQDGVLIVNSDHHNNKLLLKKVKEGIKTITYGVEKEAHLRAADASFSEYGSKFNVYRDGERLGEVKLAIPGEQNILNSLAALATGFEVGQGFENMAAALRFFTGARRRFQLIGKVGEVMIIDDYAHHPTELKATIRAARLGWGKEKRIICIFQPHRYTRTLFLKEEFGKAFEEADLVIITDVYSAGENPISGISGKSIADEAEKVKGEKVVYIPKKEMIADHIMDILQPQDMIMTCGAGDIYIVAKEIYSRLREWSHEASPRNPAKNLS
jgi:UDP-N-acetylmuramate--alanine ligase